MVVYLSLRTRCMRAGVRRIRAGGIGSGWSRACELPSCIGQIVTRSCTRYSRAVGAAAAGAPKPRGRRIGTCACTCTCSHTAAPGRHPGGHSSGRPAPSHTWHHSCRTYFVMYICVLRDLTGTTRLCDHIVRMLLAALSVRRPESLHTLGRRADRRRGARWQWPPDATATPCTGPNSQRQNVIGSGQDCRTTRLLVRENREMYPTQKTKKRKRHSAVD